MSFLDWVKRVVGRLGHGPAVAHCAVCGAAIRSADLDRSQAVMIARRTYCPLCVERIAGRKREAGDARPESWSSSSHTTTVVV